MADPNNVAEVKDEEVKPQGENPSDGAGDEKADYQAMALDKAKLELEVEKQKNNNAALKSRQDRIETLIRQGRIDQAEKEAKELSDDEEDSKSDEEIVFKKLGAAKKADVDQKLESMRDEIRREVRAERLAAVLESEVNRMQGTYPFIRPKSIEDYIKANPLSTVEQASWAVYGKQMSEFDRAESTNFPYADGSSMDYEVPTESEDLPLGNKAKMHSLITKAVMEGEK